MYSKTEALKEAVYILIPDIEKDFYKFTNKITLDKFIEIISQNSYNLSKESGMSANAVSKLLSSLFPDKPKTPIKICSYILGLVGYKWCNECWEVKTFEEFSANISRRDGHSDKCKICFPKLVSRAQVQRTAKYRASKLQRTPKWADLLAIRKVYQECPLGKHVDHIIPLQGEYVSGLHVENNLQYLDAIENCKKNNKYSMEV